MYGNGRYMEQKDESPVTIPTIVKRDWSECVGYGLAGVGLGLALATLIASFL